jgi:hypothetical protein
LLDQTSELKIMEHIVTLLFLAFLAVAVGVRVWAGFSYAKFFDAQPLAAQLRMRREALRAGY